MRRRISKKKLLGIALLLFIIGFAVTMVIMPSWAAVIHKIFVNQVWIPVSKWGAAVWAGISAHPVWQSYGIMHLFSFIWGATVVTLFALAIKFRQPIMQKIPHRVSPSTAISTGSSQIAGTPAGATTRPEAETTSDKVVEETEKTESKE